MSPFIELIAADSPNSFVDDTPSAVLIRQVLGAVAPFEKAALLAKLQGARERKRRHIGKCEQKLLAHRPSTVAVECSPSGATGQIELIA